MEGIRFILKPTKRREKNKTLRNKIIHFRGSLYSLVKAPAFCIIVKIRLALATSMLGVGQQRLPAHCLI
jgi:hypothetical protein